MRKEVVVVEEVVEEAVNLVTFSTKTKKAKMIGDVAKAVGVARAADVARKADVVAAMIDKVVAMTTTKMKGEKVVEDSDRIEEIITEMIMMMIIIVKNHKMFVCVIQIKKNGHL